MRPFQHPLTSDEPLPLTGDRDIRSGSLQAAGLPGAVGGHLQFEFSSDLLAASGADQGVGKDFEPCLGNFLAAPATGCLLILALIFHGVLVWVGV
jgi:hypothetical protein